MQALPILNTTKQGKPNYIAQLLNARKSELNRRCFLNLVIQETVDLIGHGAQVIHIDYESFRRKIF